MRKSAKGVVATLAVLSILTTACGDDTADTTETTAKADAAAETGGTAAEAAPSGEKLKFGATFPILDQFLQGVADAMQTKASELGVELTVVAAQEKADVQLGQVENFISQGLDGILVVPVDTDAAGPMTDAAVGKGVPLVYVNRRPSGLPETVPYVGSDSLYAGTVEMQALAELLGNKGNVVILQGDPANEAAILRTQGCEDVVKGIDGMEVTKVQAGNWYREEGLAIMENWIQTGDQIDAVCANNDEMALGAIEALKAAGKIDDVVVGGVDATGDALKAMEAGELEVTVFQDAAGQGAGGLEAVFKLANGETVEPFVDIPYQLVTPDNMADFTK